LLAGESKRLSDKTDCVSAESKLSALATDTIAFNHRLFAGAYRLRNPLDPINRQPRQGAHAKPRQKDGEEKTKCALPSWKSIEVKRLTSHPGPSTIQFRDENRKPATTSTTPTTLLGIAHTKLIRKTSKFSEFIPAEVV
jgi:hypothetical protein